MNFSSINDKSLKVSARVIALAICGAALTAWLLQRFDAKRARQVAIQAPTPSPTSPLLVITRPWVLHNGLGCFDFSNDEWQALTNVWRPEGNMLALPQGKVARVSEKELEALKALWPASVRTNQAWFTR